MHALNRLAKLTVDLSVGSCGKSFQIDSVICRAWLVLPVKIKHSKKRQLCYYDFNCSVLLPVNFYHEIVTSYNKKQTVKCENDVCRFVFF